MSARSVEHAEPNLTPMLDLVFQLITFFMLVVNFKGASNDLSLKLPVLGSAAPLEWSGPFEPLVLNVDTAGQVNVYGSPVDLQRHISLEARSLKDRLRDDEKIAREGLPVPVVIRADRSVPFSLLNEVIKACQQNGFRKFSLSAMTHEETR